MADFVIAVEPEHYIGLSTDTKPTSAPIGSRLFETNTGDWFIMSEDGTTWIIDKGVERYA